jgi:hypothetical protein
MNKVSFEPINTTRRLLIELGKSPDWLSLLAFARGHEMRQ